MATIRDYVKSKLSRYGVDLPDTELDVLMVDAKVEENEEYTSDSTIKAKTALVMAIPELFMQADVTEGGYSVKWDKTGLRSYYDLLCAETGVPNRLAVSQTVSDKSYLW